MMEWLASSGVTTFDVVAFLTIVKDFFHFEIFYRNIQRKETALSSQNKWLILVFLLSLVASCFLATVDWKGYLCGCLVVLVWEMMNAPPDKVPHKGPSKALQAF